MLSGMLFIFAPLVVGYLIPIANPSTLARINKITSHLIYVILSLMGLSLAALDNLSANLQVILTYTGTFFLCLGLCNLAALPLVDRLLPVETDTSTKKTTSFSHGNGVLKAYFCCRWRPTCWLNVAVQFRLGRHRQ